MRIAICGGSRCGKTTLGTKLAVDLGVHLLSTGKRSTADNLISTDNYKGAPWEAIPDIVIPKLEELEDWILEGTQATRVLRRWLRTRYEHVRLDEVYWLDRPFVPRSKGQQTQAKGIATVWADVRPLLLRKGIPIRYDNPASMAPSLPPGGTPYQGVS